MGAGKLDRRITVERFTSVKNSFNESEKVWAPLATVWASRMDVSDAEKLSADQVNATRMTRFSIRHSQLMSSVNPKDRIRYDGILWDIQGVKETKEGRGRYLELTCVGRVD